MPIANDIVSCINHPGRHMYRNDRLAILHPVELGDGKAVVIPDRGIFLEPYVCLECGYVELYAMTKQAALADLNESQEPGESAIMP